jgi:hypothetical protein
MLESGEEYGELRGAVLYADATIHRDADVVAAVGEELIARYQGRGTEGVTASTRAPARRSATGSPNESLSSSVPAERSPGTTPSWAEPTDASGSDRIPFANLSPMQG